MGGLDFCCTNTPYPRVLPIYINFGYFKCPSLLSLNLYTYCANNPVIYIDPTGHVVAKVGTKGDTVAAIQEDLKKLGYNVKVDGIFGEQTKATVIKFQKDNGLVVDGIVGNQTLTEIYFEQSKQAANAKGVYLPEQEKVAAGQLKGDVSIMTDEKYQQAINNIVEVKSKTNGGSVNTVVVGNELAVQKVNIKSDIPTAAPVIVTPKVPVPAAASAQMSTLTNQVAQVSSYMSLANISSINANKSTMDVGGGTSGTVVKSTADKVGDTVKGFAWGVLDNIPGYKYAVQTIQFNTTGNVIDPDVLRDYNSDFGNGYNFGDNLIENINIAIISKGINNSQIPAVSISPSGQATISGTTSANVPNIIFASPEFKKPISGSGKEKATDVPSWSKGNKPYTNENGNDFAKRLCDEKYGPGNYEKGPNSEFNKIKKWGDRGFK